jgi:hypothetical protein
LLAFRRVRTGGLPEDSKEVVARTMAAAPKYGLEAVAFGD